VRVWRATQRYRRKLADSGELRVRLRELAAEYPRYGYWRLYRKLRRQGMMINHKRVYRLYREEQLTVRKRPRKRLARARVPASVPTAPNERWSMDFVSDSLADGRRLRIFNVVDDCTREALVLQAETSITGSCAAVSRFTNSILSAVETATPSFWSPSRGPTSTTVMCRPRRAA